MKSLSIAIGFTLLPAAAFSLQENIEQVQLPYLQEAQFNIQMAAADNKRNPKRNLAAQKIQLAQSDTPASSEQTTFPSQKNQYPQPTTARNLEKMRVDKIKSIVSQADANSIPEQTNKQLSQPIEQTGKVSSPQQRRQQLKDIVVDAPITQDKTSRSYVSILQEEVSTTEIIDEEGARRIALPVTGIRSGSETTVLSESDDAYLYTVRSGDSLWRIAQRFYQDPNKYIDICRANREVLINEDLLHVGQVLRVPKILAKD